MVQNLPQWSLQSSLLIFLSLSSTKMGWSSIILQVARKVLMSPQQEQRILVTNVYPGNFNFLTNMITRSIMIAPSNCQILISSLCFRQSLQSSQVRSDEHICSSLNCFNSFKISFMHLILDWCLQLLPSILKMIFPRDSLYFCALNILSLEEYQMLMMSVLMAQMMLSKKLLKKAMRCQRILMILRYRGFLDQMFLMMDASWSIHFRNLNILRVFFMVPLILWATSAPVFFPSRNSASTSAISEYLLQLQQKSAMYWMTEQILSLPLQVFIIIVKAETQVAMCLPYWKDILEVSLSSERVYVDRMRLKSFILYNQDRGKGTGKEIYQILSFWRDWDYNCMDKYPECFSDVPPVFGKHQRKVAIAIFIGFQSFLYFFALLTLYALFTLNLPLILLLATISALQTRATRSQRFIDYINDVLQVRRYSKGYQIIFQQPIKENDRCLFGMHPHGVLSTGLLANMNLKSGPLSTARGLSSRFMLSCPIVGLFLRLWGVESIDKHNMKNLMKSGSNIILIPGGFEEATLTNPKELRIYIKNRKGFIKYAMENNYSIYPLLYLKEHQAFWTFDHFINFRLFLNRLKLPAVFFWNLKSLVFLPPDMEYFTIVGRKINYRAYATNQQPTPDEINKVHQDYIAELSRMYEKHKALNLNVPLKVY